MFHRKLIVALVTVTLVLTACGGGAAPTTAPTAAPAAAATSAPGSTKAAEATKAPETTKAPPPTSTPVPTPTTKPVVVKAGQTKITFWHAMGGANGVATQQMVDDFNASQDKYVVEAIFQGTYDDSLAKLKAGLASKDVPSVMQLYDIGTRFMVDSGYAVPVQTLIDAEKYDVSDLEPNVLAYYTADGKLWSMPFNTSNPILYYNKTLFQQAGLDPNKPPATFEEVKDYAKKLTKKDASGKVTQCGIVISIYGWFFEQLMAVQGQYYVDNANGRDARATKAVFNNESGQKVFDWLKDMIADGSACNVGIDNNGAKAVFSSQKAAMNLESTASLRGYVNDAQKGNWEVGTGFLPRPAGAPKDAGTIIGGASLWILKDRPVEEQKGAWEFIKFAASAPAQAKWHTGTGYYPIRKSAYNEQVDKDWVAKFPAFTTAIDQLHASPNNRYTQGALIGVFPQARQTIEKAWQSVVLGQANSKDALDKAAADVTDAITKYNRTVPAK